MIQLESAHIEEVRGIRKLDIDFGRKTFAISGPNGSGKSGVIDAIEFALTGRIGRLAGSGTKGLSIGEHGPHVDKTKFPDASFVELKLFLTDLSKSATIRRSITAPKKPIIKPADPDVLNVLAEIAEHPEIALSRREILRFILVAPNKRSEEIQTLLKLDEIGDLRSTLNTAQNSLQREHRNFLAQVESSANTLKLHLQTKTLQSRDVLGVVNERRTLLELLEIQELSATTKLDDGLEVGSQKDKFNKQSALRDLDAISESAKRFHELGESQVDEIVSNLDKLEADPELKAALQRRPFIEAGIELINGPNCPLCDISWPDERHLKDHLQAKLTKSKAARKLQESILENGTSLGQEIVRLVGLLAPIIKLTDSLDKPDSSQQLTTWATDLEKMKSKLRTLEGITESKDRLKHNWLAVPENFTELLQSISEAVQAKPDQTAVSNAHTFLITAQLRLDEYRDAKRKCSHAGLALERSKSAYAVYCAVMENELNNLYEEVQEDFSTFYRLINGEDEKTFSAKFTPTAGKLDFNVNFYDRGLFPPAAYHSEGHQDGMGVCLYLALMKRLFQDRFTLALLDDVVMSVDAGHRYEFCKLLKTQFPNTQFVITTHDRLWAEQMKSAGLVTGKTSTAFHSWTIDTGPLVESNQDIWQEINAAIEKGKVEVAAAVLRHHLEYVSRHLAGQLGASVRFRGDGNYDLGELLPSVVSRMKKLYGKAADAAQSWGQADQKKAIELQKQALSNAIAATNVEQWAINKALHYNEWANFGKNDFAPLITAFRGLLECLRCSQCESWLYVTPSIKPQCVRCLCKGIDLNLKKK